MIFATVLLLRYRNFLVFQYRKDLILLKVVFSTFMSNQLNLFFLN